MSLSCEPSPVLLGSCSYKERPIAWMGMLGEPSRFRKELIIVSIAIDYNKSLGMTNRRMRAGT